MSSKNMSTMHFSSNILSNLLVLAMEIQVNQDQESKIWAFIDPNTEYSLPKTISFGDEKFHIDIIDQFDQHRPQLMNCRSADDRQVKMAPAIILDSNTSSYIHQYVVTPQKLSPSQRNAVHELVRYLAATNYDYNPFFYYLEALTKNYGEMFDPKIIAMTESIIRLQSMNQPLFLKTGEIEPNKELFQDYVEKFGTDSYPEMARRQVEWLQTKHPSAFSELENLYSAIYICLLKMALIRQQNKKGIKQKHILLRSYMVDTLGVVMSRELYIALLYFAGAINTFIPLQEGADFERMRSRIKAAAWDALMMRLPEFYLPDGGPEPGTLAYVCTADKALQKIAKGIHIKAVLSLTPNPHSPKALLNFDYDELIKLLGEKEIGALLIENDEWQANRWSSLQTRYSTRKENGLSLIIQELEKEMRLICRR